MDRRNFLIALPAIALGTPARAYAPLQYAPQTWPDIRDNSDRVILNFRASWSLTCQIKRDILAKLLEETPRYRALTFLDVDWDTFGRAQWTERLKVDRRSTLIAMRQKTEIARIVNKPTERALRGFLDRALDS